MDLFPETEAASVRLKESMEEMERTLVDLRHHLLATPMRQARVFRLPRTKSGEEHEPYEYLESVAVEGEEAVALAASGYFEFYGGSGASTKSVYRLPGVVALQSGHHERTKQLVATINKLKEDFAAAAQSIEDKNQRFEIVHRLFPMLITLQATRQIQCYEEEVKSVTFTWGKKSSIRVVTRDALLETLRKLREQRPIAFDEARWQEAINEDVVRLLSLPADTELRYRRDLKVRPMANLLLSDGTKWLREANLPILILRPAEDFRVGILPDYNAQVKPKRGRKNPQRLTEDERYLMCLPVYRAKL